MEGPRLLVKMKPDNLIQTNLSQEEGGVGGYRWNKIGHGIR